MTSRRGWHRSLEWALWHTESQPIITCAGVKTIQQFELQLGLLLLSHMLPCKSLECWRGLFPGSVKDALGEWKVFTSSVQDMIINHLLCLWTLLGAGHSLTTRSPTFASLLLSSTHKPSSCHEGQHRGASKIALRVQKRKKSPTVDRIRLERWGRWCLTDALPRLQDFDGQRWGETALGWEFCLAGVQDTLRMYQVSGIYCKEPWMPSQGVNVLSSGVPLGTAIGRFWVSRVICQEYVSTC